MKGHLKYFFAIFFLACFLSVFPQQKIYLVTKTISKEFETEGNSELKIKGEKSDISIRGWKNKEVKIEVQLISRNPKKEKAAQDLKFIKYNLVKSGRMIILSNSFVSDKNAQISSNLSVKFHIWIPDNSSVQIENLYGDIDIESLSFKGSVRNSFGEVKISDITGRIDLDLYYADTRINNINAGMTCKAVNSELNLFNVSGEYEISSNYGSISFMAGEHLKKLRVQSSRTGIEVKVGNFEKYSYNLVTQNSDLNLPGHYAGRIQKESRISRFELNTNSHNPVIQIETTYCPITINTSNQ
jgi:hypothetical protein